MPEKYTVKITQQAQEQIREIVSYIRFTLQAPETAMKMLDTLQEEIASLDQFPNRVPLTEEEPWRSQGIHKFPVKNYLIYFWVDEETKKVQIIGAVYGRKDQRHQLSKPTLILLTIAFLFSPMGLPMIAVWILSVLQGMKGMLKSI